MEVLQKLGIALGFATLAGLNLYLTVFATSLCIHYGWVDISGQYPDLLILGSTPVMIVSGVLFAIEFFADKVPWLDSAWDSLHTIIRPLGGAFLAVKTLGQPDPTFDIVIALLAGGVTLTTHGAKASTRLVANGSPEPFSNIALSVTEDVAVGSGLGLMAYSYKHNPYLAVAVFGAIVLALLYATPKIFRFARIKIWLLWKKLSFPAATGKEAQPLSALPADPDLMFARLNPTGETVAWAAPCLTGSSKGGLTTNFSGHIVATVDSPRKLHFIGRRGWRSLYKTLDLTGCKASHESRFLSEDLMLHNTAKGTKQVFVFDRSKALMVQAIVERLRERLADGSATQASLDGETLPPAAVRELVSA